MKAISTFSTIFLFSLLYSISAYAQSKAYQKRKTAKLAIKSPFEKIVRRELPTTIEHEEVIAFYSIDCYARLYR